MKQTWKPGTVLYPLPAVLVSCGARPDEYNMLTVAWTGTVCTNPPMCYISVRPERHSYGISAARANSSSTLRRAIWLGRPTGAGSARVVTATSSAR